MPEAPHLPISRDRSSADAATPHAISAPARRGTQHLTLDAICKSFGGVQALSNVSLDLRRGEVHCLVGENGAGKSTLGKIIAGVQRADSGEIRVDEQPHVFRSPRDSIEAGIAFIAQELSIIPARSVIENVFLDATAARWGFVARRKVREDFNQLLARTGFELDPDARAGSLRLADQQKVEIMRALARNAALVVMDEPTAALGPADTMQLMAIIRDLRDRGVTVVFVTHFLAEALSVADRLTIVKDGRVIRTTTADVETPESLIESMLGRPLESMFPDKRKAAAGTRALSVDGLSRGDHFQDVSLHVDRGEIVGIAGLMGSGRSELVRAMVGVDRAESGTVEVNGHKGRFSSPRQAQLHGLVMIPESRKEQGLLLRATVADNVTLPHLDRLSKAGFVARKAERKAVEDILASVSVDPRRIDSPVSELSGGNQQKVLFAKWLLSGPSVVIADEPTRGVDVGARSVLYETLRSLADSGMGILFISSDIEEVIGFADRVLVMRAGRLVANLSGDEISEERILHSMLDYTGELMGQ